MNNNVWWTKIANAARLISDVTDSVSDRHSVILVYSDDIPFYDDMFETLHKTISSTDASSRFTEIDSSQITTDVESYMFDEFFAASAGEYFPTPNNSRTRFMAENISSDLISTNIWLKAESPVQLEMWRKFLTEYNSYCKKGRNAVFLLIMKDNGKSWGNIKNTRILRYEDYISQYDKYIYCMLEAAELKDCTPEMKKYIAELAIGLSGGDMEKCRDILGFGKQLISETFGVCRTVIPKMDERGVKRVKWETQMKLVFPILEKYRSQLLDLYLTDIKKAIPFTTPTHEVIEDPFELDLGNLKQICDNGYFKMDDKKYKKLVFFKDSRNDLAHMKPIDDNNALKILKED
ncbi:MAG: hypothetical protein IJ874_03380 [Ruminococcus sp.]|nr:hypothetical protein [Ruminococcus sp.]